MTHPSKHVPAETNGGWGAVGLVVVLAIICIVSVTMIYQRTYKNPTDPTWQSGGSTKSGH